MYTHSMYSACTFFWNTPHGCQLHPQTETEAMTHGRVVIVTNAADGWIETSCAAFMPGCSASSNYSLFSVAFICTILHSFLCLPPPASIYVVSIPVHGNLHVVLKRMLSKGIATLSCPLLFLAFLFNGC